MDEITIKETITHLLAEIIKEDFELYNLPENFCKQELDSALSDGLSSLQLVTLIVSVEDYFQISISDQTLSEINNIDDLVNAVSLQVSTKEDLSEAP